MVFSILFFVFFFLVILPKKFLPCVAEQLPMLARGGPQPECAARAGFSFINNGHEIL